VLPITPADLETLMQRAALEAQAAFGWRVYLESFVTPCAARPRCNLSGMATMSSMLRRDVFASGSRQKVWEEAHAACLSSA